MMVLLRRLERNEVELPIGGCMIENIYHLLVENWNFFSGLLWEHISIALLSSVIAIILGVVSGILLNEYLRAVNPTMMVINFLYTVPSISMLGFLIPFSGIGNATAGLL